MKVSVDENLCWGCGTCAELCPRVFELPKGVEVARVLVDTVPRDDEDTVRQAADVCPEEAILIEE